MKTKIQLKSDALPDLVLENADLRAALALSERAGVQPGGGRVLACLQNRADQLSAACGQAMPRAQALKDSAAAAGAMPK